MLFLQRILEAFARLASKAPDLASRVTVAGRGDLSVVDGWLEGPGVQRIEMDPSWRYPWLSTPGHKPLAIVAHYTATNPGTAIGMAKRRQKPWPVFAAEHRKAYPGKPVPQSSWHVSIEAGGAIVQMAPFTGGCWHAGSKTAKEIPGVGWANRTTVGVELVGHGKLFPTEQVAAACDVWRALVRAYGIPREHAMITHQSIDPTRKSDPGPVWMKQHAPAVLAFAYAP